MYNILFVYTEVVSADIGCIVGEISQGKDQRDHFYFIAMGHYKLEVSPVFHYTMGV